MIMLLPELLKDELGAGLDGEVEGGMTPKARSCAAGGIEDGVLFAACIPEPPQLTLTLVGGRAHIYALTFVHTGLQSHARRSWSW